MATHTNPRPSASLLLAVLILVLAAGGTGYAAGKITSKDIKNNTIVGKDVKNGGLTGKDLKAASVARSRLDNGCAADQAAVFGGCVRLTATGPSSFQAAMDDCNSRNGRLPTTAEMTWMAFHTEFGWADGNPSQYEFSGDYTASSPFTPIAFDRSMNPISNASAQQFWHHCVTE